MFQHCYYCNGTVERVETPTGYVAAAHNDQTGTECVGSGK